MEEKIVPKYNKTFKIKPLDIRLNHCPNWQVFFIGFCVEYTWDAYMDKSVNSA